MTMFSQEPLPKVRPEFWRHHRQLIVWADEAFTKDQPERFVAVVEALYALTDQIFLNQP